LLLAALPNTCSATQPAVVDTLLLQEAVEWYTSHQVLLIKHVLSLLLARSRMSRVVGVVHGAGLQSPAGAAIACGREHRHQLAVKEER
jgi:hypothetical protein